MPDIDVVLPSAKNYNPYPSYEDAVEMMQLVKYRIYIPNEALEYQLQRGLSERQYQGYEPDTVMMWEPVYHYFDELHKKEWGKDSSLQIFLKEKFQLDVVVVGVDERPCERLARELFYFYENPFNKK